MYLARGTYSSAHVLVSACLIPSEPFNVKFHRIIKVDLLRHAMPLKIIGAGIVGITHLYTIWLRTNGVNTNGAAAKKNNVDRLGEKYAHPGTFGKIKVYDNGSTPKNPPVRKHDIRTDPISADPICLFPSNIHQNKTSEISMGVWLSKRNHMMQYLLNLIMYNITIAIVYMCIYIYI